MKRCFHGRGVLSANQEHLASRAGAQHFAVAAGTCCEVEANSEIAFAALGRARSAPAVPGTGVLQEHGAICVPAPCGLKMLALFQHLGTHVEHHGDPSAPPELGQPSPCCGWRTGGEDAASQAGDKLSACITGRSGLY